MSYAAFMDKLRNRPQFSIHYTCNDNCKRQRPIEDMYFCSKCTEFVCTDCSEIEVDTYFCPHCLSLVLSSYAYQHGNRCQKCAECPHCSHTLTLRTINEGKTYSFTCEFCKWNARSIGLEASSYSELLAQVQAHEVSDVQTQTYKMIQNTYKNMQKEKKLREQREHDAKVLNINPNEDLDPPPETSIQEIEESLEERKMSLYNTDIEDADNSHLLESNDIPEYLMSKEGFNLANITTLEQRHEHPSEMPLDVNKLYPRRKPLLTKTAHRCRKCHTFVVKPKVGTAHAAFDRNAFAMSYLPKITISLIKQLKVKQQLEVIIYFKNPLEDDIDMTLTPVRLNAGENSVCDVDLPSDTIKLRKYDELAEQDAETSIGRKTEELQSYDNAKVIAKRYLSKVGVRIGLMPLEANTDIKFSFNVNLKPETADVAGFEAFTYTVHVNLGPTDDSSPSRVGRRLSTGRRTSAVRRSSAERKQ